MRSEQSIADVKFKIFPSQNGMGTDQPKWMSANIHNPHKCTGENRLVTSHDLLWRLALALNDKMGSQDFNTLSPMQLIWKSPAVLETFLPSLVDNVHFMIAVGGLPEGAQRRCPKFRGAYLFIPATALP